jgi:hypothetical protein
VERELAMTRAILHLAAASLSLLALPLLAGEAARAQQSTAAIGFRNETNSAVLVQGASLVNGMLRRGQPLLISSGKMAWDTQVSKGPRQITIYDANQTSRILYQGPPFQFQGYDVIFCVRPHPSQRDRVVLIVQPSP